VEEFDLVILGGGTGSTIATNGIVRSEGAVASMEWEFKADRDASTIVESTHHETRARIECLQWTIGHLVMKNQAIRFELFAAHQKIARIEQALFGAESQDLQRLLPLNLLLVLRDLCGIYPAVGGNQKRAGPK